MDLKLNNNSKLTIPEISYIPVEYIESFGDCDVNTGVDWWQTNNSSQKLECDIEVLDSESSSTYIYYSNIQSRVTYLRCNNSSTDFLVGTSLYNTDPTTIQISGRTKVVHKYSTITINGVDFSTNPGASYSNHGKIYLCHQGDNVRIRYYSFKYYNTAGTLSIDLIPVISLQEGHVGEACFYDKITNTFKYSSPTGRFIASDPLDFIGNANTVFIKDCPNIQGLNLIRRCLSATRVRLDLGNVSGSLEELLSYSTLNGFNDNYEEQAKPRLVGTWTINSYHTAAEREAAEALFDGLTIVSDNNYLAEYLLENDMLAVQTLDSTKPNYNPAAAIVLQASNYGYTSSIPFTDGGSWFMSKVDASSETSIANTVFREKTTVTDINGIVSSDTEATYDFEYFNEFQYFDHITTITGGTSTTDLGLFGNCTKLKNIVLPNSVTTINGYSFYNCNKLETINIPNSVTTFTTNPTFYNCISLKSLTIPCTINILALRGTNNTQLNPYPKVGSYSGNLTIKGTLNVSNTRTTTLAFNNIYIKTLNFNATLNAYSHIESTGNIYINSSVYVSNYGSSGNTGAFTGNRNFLEITGMITVYHGSSRLVNSTTDILHLHKFAVSTSGTTQFTPTIANISKINHIYVGTGSSRTADEAVVQQYADDTTYGWSSYISKISTWYDYNGEYKSYTVTDSLTNCTNTNPVTWPYIKRNNSYQTTITPNTGMSISEITVEMLDTDTTSPTYDTLVDITSSVYDSSTGEINIPSVTGNVVITAVAN